MAAGTQGSGAGRGLRRCLACGAVGADWVVWPAPAVGVFVAVSVPPVVAIGWALAAHPSVFRAVLFAVLALAGLGVFLWVERSLGSRACRYCGGEAFEHARVRCPRHGEVDWRVGRARNWWLILPIPILVLAFAFAGTRDDEVAHLTGPAVGAAVALTLLLLVKTRRPGARCGCDDARPTWASAAPGSAAAVGGGPAGAAAPGRDEEPVRAVQVR
jgi:hypothetical protein